MHRSGASQPQLGFWILGALLVLTFLTGGSYRASAPFLFVLRPVAILVLGYGLFMFTRAQWKAFRVPLIIAGLIMGLVALHLIPLPSALWQLLPGHSSLQTLDTLANAGPVWRPLSLVPSATLNALFALSVPFAVFMLAATLNEMDHIRLLWLLLTLAGISALLGLLQTTGLQFNLYVPIGRGSGIEATGLFANKNHQAALLAAMLPMLAVLARAVRAKRPSWKAIDVMAGCAALVLLLLLIVTGSRAGVVVGGLSLVVTLFYGIARIDWIEKRGPRRAKFLKVAIVIGSVAIAAIATVATSRGLAFSRMANAAADLRPRLWESILPIIPQYLPWGSGIGSYVEVYRAHEPMALLRDTYSNHAHNEYLEVALTAGIPGLLLLAVAAALLAYAAWRSRSGDNMNALLARLGVLIVIILAAASVADYPLRTPIMSAVFAVAVVWCTRIAPSQSNER